MARVYYYKNELYGAPVESKVITPEIFDFILENTSNYDIAIYEGDECPDDISIDAIQPFKFAIVSRKDDIFYTDRGTEYYLPNTIIFYDVKDCIFPSEFWFIAKLGNQLELRKCSGGKDVLWYNIPDRHEAVTDEKIVKRTEATFLYIKKLVDYALHASELELSKKLTTPPAPLLDLNKRIALEKLTDICLKKATKKEEVLNFIGTLREYDKVGAQSSLYYLREYLDNLGVFMFLGLDWKIGLEDLKWNLEMSLKQNFALDLSAIIHLENTESWGVDLLRRISEQLLISGFQITGIVIDSDEYVILLHQVMEKEAVENCIGVLGYSAQNFTY